MEQTIVLNNNENIIFPESIDINDVMGVIIVYRNEQVIGSVIEDRLHNVWIFSTLEDHYISDELRSIIEDNPHLLFKYIT